MPPHATPRWTIPALALALAALLAGCRGSPPSTYHVLSPLGAEDGPPGQAGLVALAVTRFPAYLARVELVRQAPSGTLDVSPSEAWAEPLGDGFARVLAEDLALVLRRPVVVVGPMTRPPRTQLAVDVDVARFDVTAQGTVLLVATWLAEDQDGLCGPARRAVLELPVDGEGASAEVVARSAAVAELARRIAAELGPPG